MAKENKHTHTHMAAGRQGGLRAELRAQLRLDGINPSREKTAVSFVGHSTWNLSGFVPKTRLQYSIGM